MDLLSTQQIQLPTPLILSIQKWPNEAADSIFCIGKWGEERLWGAKCELNPSMGNVPPSCFNCSFLEQLLHPNQSERFVYHQDRTAL